MMESWLSFALSVTAKVTLVLAAALVITRLMGRRPAAERHLVWVVAAVAVLLMPVLTALAPPLHVSVPLPAWVGEDASIAAWPAEAATIAAWPAEEESVRAAAVVADANTAASFDVDGAARLEATASPAPSLESEVTEPATAHAATQVATHATTHAPAPSRSVSIPFVLFMIWLAGVLVIGARLALEFMRVHYLARRARPFTDAELAVRARGIAAQFGVERSVRLIEGTPHMMPMTFGIIRPTLLLPSSAHAWTPVRQTAVLRHELAHIRRRDSLTQLIAELGCALYWFHPLMWFAARNMFIVREHACDDAVIACGSRTWEYAAELLDIARTTRPARATTLAAIAMARPSQLRARLAAVLDERPRQARVATKLLVPTWLGALLIVLPLSSVTPAQQQPGPRGVTIDAPRAPQSAPAPANTQPRITTHPAPQASAAPPSSSMSLADLAPLPRVAGAAWQQEDCLRGRLNNVNSNTNNDRRSVKWSGPSCSGELIIEGQIDFDPDFTRIVGMSRDGYLRLTTEEGRTERRLVMRRNGNGITHEYSVDGDRRPFDAAAQAWLDNHMMFMFRRMGFMAKERATAILQRRGAEALLTEVGLLTSDYVRAAYLEVLVAQGRLDENSLRRVLNIAGNSVSSDHYRHQIVTAVAGRYDMTDGVRAAYIGAVSQMSSDHYKHSAFDALLKKGNLTPAQTSAVLREAGRISSDHYRATLLESVARTYGTTPEIRAAFLEAAAGIDSDHYKANVLSRVLKDQLTSPDVARVVDAAATINSDHYRTQVLSQLAGTGLKEAALQRAFVRAAADIDSDHYLQQLLSSVVKRETLAQDALLAVLEAAGSIDSDYYRSVLLVDIASKYQLEGEPRTRFIRLMEGIRSSHYRGNVASAFMRQIR